jgi:hypothetical protein
MRKQLIVPILLCLHVATFAQNVPTDTIPTQQQVTDSTPARLLNDDPAYNPRYPVWVPAARVFLTDVVNWTIARYVYKYEWAKTSPETWKKNLHAKWVWDKDRFGINFIGHPHTGNYYYNVARSNGYNFLQSMPFVVEGSVIWELFGENEPPSKNDIINTTISGMFLGEVLYRISSNILDDRARGGNRVFREIFAGIINPPRFFNRLTQGKMFRVTNREVYQKEPLDITLSAAAIQVNDGKQFGGAGTNYNLTLQLDYGDPFEVKKRKPFDVFRFRLESRFGESRKLLDNVTGQGILAGWNSGRGKKSMLTGFFQHYDYWNHEVFELGTLGLGAGIISRMKIGGNSALDSRWYASVVPLAGYSTRFGADTSEFRTYNFGGGFQARVDEVLSLAKWSTLAFQGNFYWLGTYNGVAGKSLIAILKPRIQFKLSQSFGFGLEHDIYYHARYAKNFPDLHLRRSEQRVFVQIFFEDGN